MNENPQQVIVSNKKISIFLAVRYKTSYLELWDTVTLHFDHLFLPLTHLFGKKLRTIIV